MSAFVSGAVSALNKCLKLINDLDPADEDINLRDLRNQITIYIALYRKIDESKDEYPITDETWEKIKEASDAPEEELDEIKKIIFDA